MKALTTIKMNTCKMRRVALALGMVACLATAQAETFVQYVKTTDQGGTYKGDGASWETAKNNVQNAINACRDAIKGGATDAIVYVAAGVYKPTGLMAGGTNSQYQSFQIYEGITVKGGYAGTDGMTMATPSGDESSYRTIFDGNLDNSGLQTRFDWNDRKQRFDTEFPENAFHVVTFATNGFDADGHGKALGKPAALENVVVQNGRAYSTDADGTSHPQIAYGGGIYLVGNATVRDCEVRHCFASRNGAGVYLDGGGEVVSSDIHDNQTLGLGIQFGYGGGVAVRGAGKVLRSYIYNNVGRMGGGVALVDATDAAVAVASLVANNTATTEAGGVYLLEGGVLNSMSIYLNRNNGSGARIDGVVTGMAAGLYCMDGGKVFNTAIWGNAIAATNGQSFNDIQFYAFSKTGTTTRLTRVAMSNSDRVNWSYTSSSNLTPLDISNSDIKLAAPTATPGVMAGTDVKTAFDATPQARSALIAIGLQNSIPGTALANQDLKGSGISPVCDLGAVMATQTTAIEGVMKDGVYCVFVDPKGGLNEVVTHEGKLGASWNNPATNINDALEHMAAYKAQNPSAKLCVYVKEGTLVPANTNSTSLREATLSMVSDCSVLGGYPTELTATNLEQTLNGATLKRNPMAYPTVLAGSIGSNGSYADNVAHLVTFSGVSNATLDGFELRNGNAFGTANNYGAGIIVSGGTGNTIRNCSVVGCSAAQGAGLYVTGNAKQLLVENTIFHNNGVIDHSAPSVIAGRSNPAAIIATGANVTATFEHCDVIHNVGYGLYAQGSTNVALNSSAFYANLNQELANTNNWPASGALLCAPVVLNGGNVTSNHSLFDEAFRTEEALLNKSTSVTYPDFRTDVSASLLKSNPSDVATYPQFKNATRNCGVSTVGDITFYGNEVDFTPSNMNPMTNAAASGAGTDMIGIPRSHGGMGDIGALENYLTQPYVELDANGNFKSGAVMYVREYRKADGTIDNDHTTTSEEVNDGSSWARAINGNAPYSYGTNKVTYREERTEIFHYEKQEVDVPDYKDVTTTVTTYDGFLIKTGNYYLKITVPNTGNPSLSLVSNKSNATVWYLTNTDVTINPTTGAIIGGTIAGEHYIKTDVNGHTYAICYNNSFYANDRYNTRPNYYRMTLTQSGNGYKIYNDTGNRYIKINGTSLDKDKNDKNATVFTFELHSTTTTTTETVPDGSHKEWIDVKVTDGWDIHKIATGGGINGLQCAVNTQYDGGLYEGKNREVWVGEGTYTRLSYEISNNSVSQSYAYMMKEHVDVYGGFPATGNPGMKERQPKIYETILQPQAASPYVTLGAHYKYSGSYEGYVPTDWGSCAGKTDGTELASVGRVLVQPSNFATETAWDGFTLRYGYLHTAYMKNIGAALSALATANLKDAGGAGALLQEKGRLTNCVVKENLILCYPNSNEMIKTGDHVSTKTGSLYTFLLAGAGVYMGGNSTGAILENCEIAKNQLLTKAYNRTTDVPDNLWMFGGGLFQDMGNVYNTIVHDNDVATVKGSGYTKSATGSKDNNEMLLGGGAFIASGNFFNNTIVNNMSTTIYWCHNNHCTFPGIHVKDNARIYNTLVADNEGHWGYQHYGSGTDPGNGVPVSAFKDNESSRDSRDATKVHVSYSFVDVNKGTANVDLVSLNDNGNTNIYLNKAQGGANATNKTDDVYYKSGANGTTPENIYHLKDNSVCINAGTEDIAGVIIPSYDAEYTDRVKDCRIDIGAYEYNGAKLIASSDQTIDGKSYRVFFVSQNGRGTTQATNVSNAACWQKIQKVLDAAGRYKYLNPTANVLVKLAGEATPDSKTMKALYDDAERDEETGEMFAFKYSPRNLSDLNSDDQRDYSLMVPRGVEVWGGYYVANNERKMANGANEFSDAPYSDTAEYGRSVTEHPTVLDGRYDSSDRTQYVYAYHTLTFTDQVFDAEHKPYLSGDAGKVSFTQGSSYTNQTEGFLSLEQKGVTDRAVVDGLFITGGRANKPEQSDVITSDTKAYGGAGILTDFAHVRNCIVEDNQALQGGGAFLLQPGSMISGTLIKKNSARDGGGIYFQPNGLDANGNELTTAYEDMARVYTTTIVDNTAEDEGGGAWFFNNARLHSTVLWGNYCGNQKNIYGAMPEYGNGNFAYAYTAVENVRMPGINNLSMPTANDQGVRFEDRIYYGLDTYSALVNTGEPINLYMKWDGETAGDPAYLALAKKDFMGRERVRQEYEFITIGARAEFHPEDAYLITRLYVDVNQSADLSYDEEEAVRYFESLGKDAETERQNPVYSQRGSNNGFPMHSLQEAIDYIVEKRTHPVASNGNKPLADINTKFEIIMTDGEYYPSRGIDAYDPTNFTFPMPDNVSIMGGMINTVREDGKFLGQANASVGNAKVAELSWEQLLAKREELRTYDENNNNVIEPWEMARQTIISGNVVNSSAVSTNAMYVITIDAKTNKGVAMNGVTVSDGMGSVNGGGLLISSSTVPVQINQSQFVNNSSLKGGAIMNRSTLNIFNSFFANNHATKSDGGAIYSENTLLATNTLFANNEAEGRGGAISSGLNDKSSTLRLVNCDVVMNKAANWPAIYSAGAVNQQNNQVLNSVFWGNQTSGANKEIIPNATGKVFFTAYEEGCGPEAVINNDERVKTAGSITNKLVPTSTLTQNSNLLISSDNDALDGPNFGNPSVAAGVAGYSPEASFLPYRENRLIDAGWGWIAQNAAGTEYGSAKGGAYAVVEAADNTQLAIGAEPYIFTEMNRISLNPSSGTETKAYIDLGIYELVRVPLQVAGVCVDELWVSTVEKSDNGVADGSSWLTPTTNVQGAINTLLSSRCGHHKVLHVIEGTYVPVQYGADNTQNFVINTGALNESSNIYGYSAHKNGGTLDVTDPDDPSHVIATYQYGDANAEAYPGIASFTIIGGYSKDISQSVEVTKQRWLDGEQQTQIERQGVRDGEKYPTLLTSNFESTSHVIDISDARQWYGHGMAEAIPQYVDDVPRLKKSATDNPTVVPMVIEGLQIKNANSDQQGAAVNYAPVSYTTEANGNIIYLNTQVSDGKTYYCVADADGMPKLTVSHDILFESGKTTASSALFIGQGGGESLVVNSLFHNNAGNAITGENPAAGIDNATKVVNATIAENGGKVQLADGSSIFGSILWENAKGLSDKSQTNVTDLRLNAITGIAEDAANHNTPLNKTNHEADGPNFKNPAAKDYHLSASAKTMNIIDHDGEYVPALGAWYNMPLIRPYLEHDLAFVDRWLPANVERGAYEFQQSANRVLYYDPNKVSAANADGLSWDKAFGIGNLQATINLAKLYSQMHNGEQAYVYARGGVATGEVITLTPGVSVYGSLSTAFEETCEDDSDQLGEQRIDNNEATSYESLVRQTRPGLAGPNTQRTIIGGVVTNGTYSRLAVVDGFEIAGDVAIQPAVENAAPVVLRNSIVHDANTLATSNVLIYNVLFRNNAVPLTLGQRAYAVHVTTDKAITGQTSSNTYYSNVNYAGSTYKWEEPYLDLNYQLDETDAKINSISAGNPFESATHPGYNLKDQINFATDRDVLGNPRTLFTNRDAGCFEMWKIDDNVLATYDEEQLYVKAEAASAPILPTHVWRNNPHEGSYVYIMESDNLVLDASLKTVNVDSKKKVEAYNLMPGYLLVKEDGSLYGQGVNVKVPYVATEQTIREEGNLVALPYKHNYDATMASTDRSLAVSDGGAKFYSGIDRAAWKYAGNVFEYAALNGSNCWQTAEGEVPANMGVFYNAAVGTHRFTSKGADFSDNEMLYTENGDKKNVTLTQYNILADANGNITNGHLTAKEDMGWNLFGIPYLVSQYKPYEKTADEFTYMMQLPKELWLYFDGATSPDGTTVDLNKAGFYAVNSWDAATWHQAAGDMPRLWVGEGMFTQTSTIKDKELLEFQFPIWTGETIAPVPGMRPSTRMFIDDNIENLDDSHENDSIYDLNGRRVQTPDSRSLYIVNGKKVWM